jgi:hypothetical protein
MSIFEGLYIDTDTLKYRQYIDISIQYFVTFTLDVGNITTSTPSRKIVQKRKQDGIVPILTNTSLMLLRLCGKYLHLMQMLEPISENVFISMTELLDFYLLTVFNFFTTNLVSINYIY